MRSGREQRRRRNQNPIRRYLGVLTPLSIADRKTIEDFHDSREGAFGAFYFWRPDAVDLIGFAAGTVSGSATFTLPLTVVDQRGVTQGTLDTIYVAGVSKAFTNAPGTGPGGEDVITFTAGAQTGAVTVDATAVFERIIARFETDDLENSWAPTSDQRAVLRIAIKQLVN